MPNTSVCQGVEAAEHAPPSHVRSLCARANPAILTIAHRGVWTKAPENSLASIRDAIDFGVDIVEIDTQSTLDGQLVVIHDETLDRTTTGRGVVAESELAFVRKAHLRVGAGGADAAVDAEVVPTLEECLEAARGRIAVNIDTKYEEDLPLVIETVRRLRMQEEVIVKSQIDPVSGHFPVLFEEWYGEILYMPVFRIRPGRFTEDLQLIEVLRAQIIEVKFSDLADISAARSALDRHGIRVWINTLNVSHSGDFHDDHAMRDPEAVWGVLADAGVGAIQTDAIEAFKSWSAGRQASAPSLR